MCKERFGEERKGNLESDRIGKEVKEKKGNVTEWTVGKLTE
jgi:hypothetical protein